MVSHMKSTTCAIFLIGLLTAASGFRDLLRLVELGVVGK
jgi:hypothetical protein